MNQLLHTPEGVRDIYGKECAKKIVLEDKIRKTLKQYGYQDIETPSFEFFDVFSKEVGTISSRELYKFFDRDGNTLVLRPDITPSIARTSATLFAEEELPIRLCYAGQTFINHSSYQGRLKETTQLGAELIGDDSAAADAELIALVIESLRSAGLKDFQVSIGQVNFYKSLIREAGIDDETEEVLKAQITGKNHFGVEELLTNLDITEECKQVLLKLPELFGTSEILEQAKQMTSNAEACAAISRLEEIYDILKIYGLESYASFDLGMIGNYMYYTGVVFRAYTFGTGDAVVKGGRYDNLLSSFGKDAPAIGFAIVVDELMNAMTRQKIELPYQKDTTLIVYQAEHQKVALELTLSFRKKGLNVALLACQEGKVVEDYKAYGRQNHMGGILYMEDVHAVRVINLEQDTEQTADISVLLQN